MTIIFIATAVLLSGCESTNPYDYPYNSDKYVKTDSRVGCESNYSDDKQSILFKTDYKDHRMRWGGQVELSASDSVSLNLDGKGLQDLIVDFSNEEAGYNLEVGDWIFVTFVMKKAGGCIMPFYGKHGVLDAYTN